MELTLQTSVQYLKGVGEKRAKLYQKLGIATVRDLLWHFPRQYIDLSNPLPVAAAPFGEPCALCATLTYKSREQRIRKGLSIFKLTARDAAGSDLSITIFNAKYQVEKLREEEEYIFWGPVGGSLHKREMLSPMIFPLEQAQPLLPVYPQTAGLSSLLIRRTIAQALQGLPAIPDPLPTGILQEFHLPPLIDSLGQIHFPADQAAAALARDRFVFQELLTLNCALFMLRGQKNARSTTPFKEIDFAPFWQALPFSPTSAQRRCVREATEDMRSGQCMSRLLQGDVGSGKTLVAAACIYFAVQNGRQAAMMAPTEILAEQHYDTLRNYLEPLGIPVALLTGSSTAAERRAVLAGLRSGAWAVCVGTHALLSGDVEFQNLGLVIPDEQHRFGVEQRQTLLQKGEDAHMLVMSATPIPRTLSLIIYGDLQLSLLDEMPPGRKPVNTLLIDSAKRARAMRFVREHLDAGRQAYIVCPLIEADETTEAGIYSAVEYAQELQRTELLGYSLEVLHGKMKPKDKDAAMRRFKRGEVQVLVATTVVEVGVDVPNATIMFIQNAERFGLSQLHQLRGRIGRGAHESWCILLSDSKGENARSRLKMMKSTTDGFQLAEFDLQMRGPGDFFGNRQHGLPNLQVASLADNMEVLQAAQEAGKSMLARDPSLSLPEHAALRREVVRMMDAVGGRPN